MAPHIMRERGDLPVRATRKKQRRRRQLPWLVAWARRTSRAAPAPYYGWALAVTLGVTTIISYGATTYLFGVLIVPMGREFGWDRASQSGAYALMLLVAGLFGMPIGRLVDRRGARAAMALGSVLGGLSLLGLTQVRTLWQFYLLWAGGLGLATALYPVSFTVVANWLVRSQPNSRPIGTIKTPKRYVVAP
jgi:MFS family permease